MSAQWLPILASPKNPNKHLGKKGTMSFSTESFDKVVASIQTSLQPWPRSIPRSAFFYENIERLFPRFNRGSAAIGTEFATRILLAASKAATTGAAVKIPASEIFIYAASTLGFKQIARKDYLSEGARAKQFLIRRKRGGSAACMLRDAVNSIGLGGMVEVSIFANARGTQIVLLPTGQNLIALAALHDAYTTDEPTGDESVARVATNHVQRYMNSLPAERLRSSADKKSVFSKIDRAYGNNPYRAVLREAVADGFAGSFASYYRDPSAGSPRVFATGQSLQFMPGWLRNELFPNWFEIDFSNMHLSILNAQAGLGIDLARSIWDQIFDEWRVKLDQIYDLQGRDGAVEQLDACGLTRLFSGSLNSGEGRRLALPAQRIDLSKTKKALKASLYSLQFGMEAPAARRAFTIDLLNLGLDFAEVTVLGNLWSETSLLRTIYDGMRSHCEDRALDSSSLAIRCQEIETDLVKKIYSIAGRYNRKHLCITVHSHDGVSVWARSARIGRRFYRKCQRILGSELARLGIQSRLEAKGLDTAEEGLVASAKAVGRALITAGRGIAVGCSKATYSTGPP
jgi:hypothetical protein